MTKELASQPSPSRHFTFVMASARRDGNTHYLARKAAEKLPSNFVQQWLQLVDLPLPPFKDLRHTVGDYPQPEGNEKTLFEATLSASDLVFVMPLYWFSIPASAKAYLDYWSGWMRVPGAQFKSRMAGKTMWIVSVLSESREDANSLVRTLGLTADYLKMNFGGALIGVGTHLGEVAKDEPAIAAACTFFASSFEQMHVGSV